MATPQFGLMGAEAAQQQGLMDALGSLDLAAQGLQGTQALTGLLGPEQQAQAFADFQRSPGQTFLQEEGERALLRNQAAIGGLRGGNVRRELMRFGQGLASQDLQNQLQNRLATIQTATPLASNAAQLQFNTGQNIGANRLQAGRDIAGQSASTTSALSQLINQQGAGLSDIVGSSASNIAGFLRGSGANQADLQTQLAALIANINAGNAAGVQPITKTGGAFDNVEAFGNLLQGGGAAYEAFQTGSDKRLKTNINLIGEFKGLNIYSWDWIDGAKEKIGDYLMTNIGFIAQEVESLYPDAVFENDQGYKIVNYGVVLNG